MLGVMLILALTVDLTMLGFVLWSLRRMLLAVYIKLASPRHTTRRQVMDEEDWQARVEELKDKATHDRFVAVEARVTEIERLHSTIIGWVVRGVLIAAAYVFKDPVLRLWGILTGKQ